MEIQYLGHAGFRLFYRGTEIVVDPYFTPDQRRREPAKFDFRTLKPQFVLITHEHFDHCDEQVVRMFAEKLGSKVIGPPPVERKLGFKIIKVRPGNKLDYPNFTLKVMPAFHHQSEFPVGYLLDFDGVRVYHAGDTYYNAELGKINTDVALLPIGGHFTMDMEEALKLAEEMAPRIVIPMHFSTFEQIQADPYEMAKRSDRVVVLKEGESIEVNR